MFVLFLLDITTLAVVLIKNYGLVLNTKRGHTHIDELNTPMLSWQSLPLTTLLKRTPLTSGPTHVPAQWHCKVTI